jgi:molecular chaperone GrpE
MEYIYKELINILEANGLEAIDPKSQPFNPKEHEAVESVPVEDKKEDDIVLSVIKKGYNLNGKVIRPAQVKIGNLEK